ncbi:hypothetical protein [Nannocystis pusilla]|uniref:hypothetical protein n=1 Tax=Nannocystis pusilla TaxID=889268 RepID=UPI003B7EF574
MNATCSGAAQSGVPSSASRWMKFTPDARSHCAVASTSAARVRDSSAASANSPRQYDRSSLRPTSHARSSVPRHLTALR